MLQCRYTLNAPFIVFRVNIIAWISICIDEQSVRTYNDQTWLDIKKSEIIYQSPLWKDMEACSYGMFCFSAGWLTDSGRLAIMHITKLMRCLPPSSFSWRDVFCLICFPPSYLWDLTYLNRGYFYLDLLELLLFEDMLLCLRFWLYSALVYHPSTICCFNQQSSSPWRGCLKMTSNCHHESCVIRHNFSSTEIIVIDTS
jgi:hypothetical protein